MLFLKKISQRKLPGIFINEFIPVLANIFPNTNSSNLPNENIWFQQDDTPSHYAHDVPEFLNKSVFLRGGLLDEN